MNTVESMLAISFPPARGYHGAMTTILDLARHGLPRPGFIATKWEATNLIFQVGMQSQRARGKGSKARRRIAGMIGARMRSILWDGSIEKLQAAGKLPPLPLA